MLKGRQQMLKLYDQFNEYLERSPWQALGLILAVLGAIYTACHNLLGHYHNWINPKYSLSDGSTDWWVLQGILSIVATMAVFMVPMAIYIFIKYKKHNSYNLGFIRINASPIEVFEKELPQSNCLRIFASNGETAKSLFLAFHRKNLLMHNNLNVQVLMRSINGDTNRDEQLKNQAQRWESDVDNLLSNSNHRMQTSFRLYECPVMLSGYIFDDRIAMLAWYSRPNGGGRHRSLPNPPLIYLSAEDSDSKKLLDDAIKIFDCHYSTGRELQ